MKRLVLLLLLAAFLAITISAQGTCPSLSISGPAAPIYPGDFTSFAIKPDFDFKGLRFQWTISSGTITSGQGSPVIEVRTDPQTSGSSIIARVEISGLPDGCRNIVSEAAGIKFPGDPPILEEYENLPVAEELDRLNAVAVEWAKYPS